jgi:HSP20 family protein
MTKTAEVSALGLRRQSCHMKVERRKSMTKTQPSAQSVPVQIHQTDELIVLAAPMPGLEPQDISVVITGDKVTIRGSYRGSRREKEEVLVAEWTIGPYEREVVLPQPVNGPLTNATYGNGVLMLAMPKAEEEREGGRAEFQIEVVQATLGQRIGHTGSDLRPTTTEEHRRRMEAATEKHESR